MGFRDEIKVDTTEDEEKILLIIEDSIFNKLKYFLSDISKSNHGLKQGQKLNYAIYDNLEDAWDFYTKHIKQIDIVLLDCGVPRKPNTNVALYAGLEIMPRIINRNNDVSIIFNTPARIQYEGLNPNNVIYVSKNRTVLSSFMERKNKSNSRLHFILETLSQCMSINSNYSYHDLLMHIHHQKR